MFDDLLLPVVMMILVVDLSETIVFLDLFLLDHRHHSFLTDPFYLLLLVTLLNEDHRNNRWLEPFFACCQDHHIQEVIFLHHDRISSVDSEMK